MAMSDTAAPQPPNPPTPTPPANLPTGTPQVSHIIESVRPK